MKRHGDDFGKLGIGVPYFKAQYEFWRWWTWLLVGGFRNGDRILNSENVPGEVPIPLAHNALVLEFLPQKDLDTLLIIEDDHVGHQDTIERLRTKPENLDFDIVCASYTNRRNDLTAVGVMFKENGVNDYGEITCIIEPLKVAKIGTQEYDCAALGCVLIRRWVLEAMLGDNKPEDYPFFDWRLRNSQDIQFYARAKAVGARVGVDRDNAIGHIGKYTYTMEDYYKQREGWLKGLSQQEAIENG